ncbi:MAG TPA: EamA family transporter [Ignavibacteriaceae bacterium]|nr:EamA family transporter [Ignavibacteriaceae bacterium]
MNNNLKIGFVYILLCFIWGSTWIVIRSGLTSLTPIISAGYRFTLASFFVFSLMKYNNFKLQTDRTSAILYIFMAFFSYVFPYSLVYWAESPQAGVPSGLSAVLFGVYPFFIALFSFFFIKNESVNVSQIIGMISGFLGIVIIFSDSFSGNISSFLLGMAAVVLSAVMQAAMLITIKKYGHHLNPLSMNFIPMFLAGIVLLSAGYSVEDVNQLKFDSAAVLSILYLAFFGSTVTFTSYYWLLKRVNVVVLSMIAFITPIVALLLGWIFYNEQLSFNLFLGTLLVLSGLLAANLGNLRKFNNLGFKKT